jgi:hypothetical protein
MTIHNTHTHQFAEDLKTEQRIAAINILTDRDIKLQLSWDGGSQTAHYNSILNCEQ